MPRASPRWCRYGDEWIGGLDMRLAVADKLRDSRYLYMCPVRKWKNPAAPRRFATTLELLHEKNDRYY